MSSKIDGYLDVIRNKNVRTAKVFGSHLRDFDKYNDEKTDEVIADLAAGKRDYFQVLNGYIGFLKAKHTLSNKYIGYSVKTARRFLSYHDVDVPDSKFRQKVAIPRAEKRRPSLLEKSDVIKILNECKEPRLKIYVHFLAATGCRAEEALSLRLGDFNFEKGMAHLRGEFTKTQQDRDVRLTAEIRRELQSWLEYKYRQRTIKSYDSENKLVVRDLKPERHPLDFIFMPYDERERKMTSIDKIRVHTKNAYLTIYKTFRPTMDRIGYGKCTFHTFRRHAYSTVSSLIDTNYAEYFIGHEQSEYWGKTSKQLEELFKKIEGYLTYLDVESLEAKQKDFGSKLDRLEAENVRLQSEIERLKVERSINGNTQDLIENRMVREIVNLQMRVRQLEGTPEPPKMTDKELHKMTDEENMKYYGTTDVMKIKEILRRVKEKQIDRHLGKYNNTKGFREMAAEARAELAAEEKQAG